VQVQSDNKPYDDINVTPMLDLFAKSNEGGAFAGSINPAAAEPSMP